MNVVSGGGIGGGAGVSGGGGGAASGQNQTAPKRSAAEVAQLASLVAFSLNNAGSGSGDGADNKEKSEEDLKKAEQVRNLNVSVMIAVYI